MFKSDAIIVDIDGTLANVDHRRHFVRDGKKQWKRFFDAMDKDTLVQPVNDIINMVRGITFSQVLLVSGRGEEYRSVTENWLKEHQVDYNALYMRRAKDYRSDVIVKSEIYDNDIAPYYNVWFVIDDRPSVIRMWREKGLFVFAVGDGEEF